MTSPGDACRREFESLVAEHEPGLFDITARLMGAYVEFDAEVHRRESSVRHYDEEEIIVRSLRNHFADEQNIKVTIGVSDEHKIHLAFIYPAGETKPFTAGLYPRPRLSGRHFDETSHPLVIARTLEDFTQELRQGKAMATVKPY